MWKQLFKNTIPFPFDIIHLTSIKQVPVPADTRVKGSANGDKDKVGIRVKGKANDGKDNVRVRVRVKGKANEDSQQKTEDNSGFASFLLQIFGVRV